MHKWDDSIKMDLKRNERNHFEDVGVSGRILLQWILKEYGRNRLEDIDVNGNILLKWILKEHGRDQSEDLGINGMILLKLILNGITEWIGFICIMICTSGGLL